MITDMGKGLQSTGKIIIENQMLEDALREET